jgi:hypothetical protein
MTYCIGERAATRGVPEGVRGADTWVLVLVLAALLCARWERKWAGSKELRV